MTRRLSQGFTLVELIVVIVVIAILATIMTVLYMGAQTQARDNEVRDAANKFAQSIELMSSKQNESVLIAGGYNSTKSATLAGCVDGAGGYQAAGYGALNSNFQCTLGDAVVAAGYLPASFFTSLPPNKSVDNTPLEDFITEPCSDGHTYLFYYQEAPTDAEVARVNNLLSGACSATASNVSGRGMGNYVRLDVLQSS